MINRLNSLSTYLATKLDNARQTLGDTASRLNCCVSESSGSRVRRGSLGVAGGHSSGPPISQIAGPSRVTKVSGESKLENSRVGSISGVDGPSRLYEHEFSTRSRASSVASANEHDQSDDEDLMDSKEMQTVRLHPLKVDWAGEEISPSDVADRIKTNASGDEENNEPRRGITLVRPPQGGSPAYKNIEEVHLPHLREESPVFLGNNERKGKTAANFLGGDKTIEGNFIVRVQRRYWSVPASAMFQSAHRF